MREGGRWNPPPPTPAETSLSDRVNKHCRVEKETVLGMQAGMMISSWVLHPTTEMPRAGLD